MSERMACRVIGGPLDGQTIPVATGARRVRVPMLRPKPVTHFDDPATWDEELGFPYLRRRHWDQYVYRVEGDTLVPDPPMSERDAN